MLLITLNSTSRRTHRYERKNNEHKFARTHHLSLDKD